MSVSTQYGKLIKPKLMDPVDENNTRDYPNGANRAGIIHLKT